MSDKSKKLGEIPQLIGDVHQHSINHHTRELYVHGHYASEEPGVDYRMATTFVKNLHILEHQGRSNILVHMHTVGGAWPDGMGMFDSIRHATSSITILTYAHAPSMSGILLQSADKRILMPNTHILIHHGSISLEDTCEAAEEAINQNKRDMQTMLRIFAGRAKYGEYFASRKYSEKRIMGYIDQKIRHKNDWYLDAEEAVHYGFADGILGEQGFETVAKVRKSRKWKS
jgi:ATP-dependent protease ClpP protease subunit